jgi:hypothetical protein
MLIRMIDHKAVFMRFQLEMQSIGSWTRGHSYLHAGKKKKKPCQYFVHTLRLCAMDYFM